MRLKTTVGALLAVGLLTTGCGGVEIPMEEQSTLETRKDELPSCYNQQFERVFYSDAALTNEVGWWHCYCGDNSAWVSGRWQSAPYYQDFNVEECGW